MTIQIEERNVYGNPTFYVVCQAAPAIAKLTGKKTVSLSDITALKALGIECQRAALQSSF